MIRTLIVDDAPLAREGIRIRLHDEADIEIVGEAADGPEAVAGIGALRPDLVFLDIRLPGYDGFEALDKVAHLHLPAVIFVTAFDSYALKAFEAHALDYLLKPVVNKRFREAVQRARNILAQEKHFADACGRLGAFLDAQQSTPRRSADTDTAPASLSRFVVKNRDHFMLLRDDEVAWIQAAGDYAHLHAHGRTFLIRTTMAELDRRLDSRRFTRVHRSVIVNLDCVKEIRPQSHGDFQLLLSDGTVLRMSRAYRGRVFV